VSGDYQFVSLSDDLTIAISPQHKFGTDAFLLADFCSPRSNESVCDLGSGCGIIPLLWLREEKSPKHIYAVELMEGAYSQMLATSQANPSLDGNFIPIHADLRALAGILPAEAFDLVSCNPPYYAPNTGILASGKARLTARHESESSCNLDDVCKSAKRLLRYGGRLCLCLRPERLADAMTTLRANNLEPKTIRFVHQRPEKAPWLFLLEGRKGGKPFLNVLPPLIVENPDKSFSQEMNRIYKINL